jgi:hypothetical protein
MPVQNGWLAVRATWTGALGMYWLPPLPSAKAPTFNPASWKPNVPGKTYAGIGSGSTQKTVKKPVRG